MTEPTASHVAAILNAAWLVRHYCRPGQVELRRQAIQRLAQVTQFALSCSGVDYEEIFGAVLDGLAPAPAKLRF